jgi:dihydroneopterin aldolase
MKHHPDILSCHGMTFDCYIGFYPSEKEQMQNLEVSFVAEVQHFSLLAGDHKNAIQMDYHRAFETIREFIVGRHFQLIETVGQRLAELLITTFPSITKISVTVTKKPPHLLGATVSYTCEKAA